MAQNEDLHRIEYRRERANEVIEQVRWSLLALYRVKSV